MFPMSEKLENCQVLSRESVHTTNFSRKTAKQGEYYKKRTGNEVRLLLLPLSSCSSN